MHSLHQWRLRHTHFNLPLFSLSLSFPLPSEIQIWISLLKGAQLKSAHSNITHKLPPSTPGISVDLHFHHFSLWKWFLCPEHVCGTFPPSALDPALLFGHSWSQAMGEVAILSLPGQSQGSLGNGNCVEVRRRGFLLPPGLCFCWRAQTLGALSWMRLKPG